MRMARVHLHTRQPRTITTPNRESGLTPIRLCTVIPSRRVHPSFKPRRRLRKPARPPQHASTESAAGRAHVRLARLRPPSSERSRSLLLLIRSDMEPASGRLYLERVLHHRRGLIQGLLMKMVTAMDIVMAAQATRTVVL